MSDLESSADSGWAGRFVGRGVLGSAAEMGSLGKRLGVYLEWQAGCWPRLSQALSGLEAVRTREIELAGRRVRLQFNPGRAVSTTARVDAAAIRERPCFLCPDNLPPEEKGLPFRRYWVLLANPAPILPQHFVLAHREHRPQCVRDALSALLSFAEATQGCLSVFYNGPACGASAPDHLHLQAVRAGSLPREREAWETLGTGVRPFGGWLVDRARLKAWVVTPPGPSVLCFHGEAPAVGWALRASLDALGMVLGEPDEPRVNLVASARQGRVLALVFPRAAHRPACYHAPEPQRCLVSPGAIDMAGEIVTVRERDFEGLDAAAVAAIYRETALAPEQMSRVQHLCQRRLAHV